MSLDFHSRAWNFRGYFWPDLIAHARPRFTLPRLSAPVALKLPGVKITLSHLGHPYEGKCVVLIRKHCNAFAPLSALHYDPLQLCNALMLAQGNGVWHKFLSEATFHLRWGRRAPTASASSRTGLKAQSLRDPMRARAKP